jgi:hypothetical protein
MGCCTAVGQRSRRPGIAGLAKNPQNHPLVWEKKPLSVVGKESGAHINPAVTMVFWLFRKLDGRMWPAARTFTGMAVEK